MPTAYLEAHICATLQITYTELEKQPTEWIDRMMEYHDTKARAEKFITQSKTPKTKAV